MSVTSYAQNFEDVLLWRALCDVEQGNYLDIGAQDPRHDSVSRIFYEHGWRGIHVEPTPAYAAALRLDRPDEEVIEAAVGTAAGLVEIHEFPQTGLSTGVAEIAEKHVEAGFASRCITVPCVSLSALLARFGNRSLHWMKIDVEGMEQEVLRSWADHPCRPWVVLVEATLPNTQVPTHFKWEAELKDRGYQEVWFDGLSRWYLASDQQERRSAFERPPNIFDGFHISSAHFTAGPLRDELRQAGELLVAEQEARRAADLNRALVEQELEIARSAAAELEEQARSTADELARTQSELATRERDFRLDLLERLHEAAGQSGKREQAVRDEARLDLAAARAAFEVEASRLRQEAEEWRQRFDAALAKAERDEASRLALYERQLASLRADGAEWRGRHDAAVAAADAREEERRNQFAQHLDDLRADRDAWRRRQEELEQRLQHEAEALRSLQDRLELEQQQGRQHLADAQGLAEERGTALARLQREKEQGEVAAEQERQEQAAARRDAERQHALEMEELRADLQRVAGELTETQSTVLRTTQGLTKAEEIIRRALAEPAGHWHRLARALRLVGEDRRRAILSEWRGAASADQHRGGESNMSRAAAGMPDNPYLRASSLNELLSWHDVDFVRCAYVTILGRQPDSDGEAFYARLIRDGYSKLHILWQLRTSKEALRHDPGIAGLDKALRRAAWGRKPFIGALVRLFVASERDNAMDRSLRAAANRQAYQSAASWHGIQSLKVHLTEQERRLGSLEQRSGEVAALGRETLVHLSNLVGSGSTLQSGHAYIQPAEGGSRLPSPDHHAADVRSRVRPLSHILQSRLNDVVQVEG